MRQSRTLLVLTLSLALFVGAIVGGFIAKSMHKAETRISHAVAFCTTSITPDDVELTVDGRAYDFIPRCQR